MSKHFTFGVPARQNSHQHHDILPRDTSLLSDLSQDSTDSSGMSANGKAGFAIGLILGIGVILSLVIFSSRQYKKAAEKQHLDDGKFSADYDAVGGNRRDPSTRSARTASTAVRPVTQFLPNLGERRSSRGNNLAMASTTAPVATTWAPQSPSPQSAWERPMTSDSQNRTNPFDDHAEPVDTVKGWRERHD
jgi:hypothetical protein